MLSQSLPTEPTILSIDDDDNNNNNDDDENGASFLRNQTDNNLRNYYFGNRYSYKRAIHNYDYQSDSQTRNINKLKSFDRKSFSAENIQQKPKQNNDDDDYDYDDDDVDNQFRPIKKLENKNGVNYYKEQSEWTLNNSSVYGLTQQQSNDLFPMEIQQRKSIQNLRNRRDQRLKGNRTPKARRAICKSGERNVEVLNIPERSLRFFKDFVTTLIEERWRYTLTVFSMSYFACWILFAFLWYLIAYSHGDFNFDPVTGERLGEGKTSCVSGCETFAGYLLLSIETQVSIGFGEKYPNEECPEAIFVMIVQIIIGVAIEGAMVGIVYAKMARPPKRSADIKFSRKAVICLRDGKLCVVFRICDPRETHVISTKVKACWLEERHSIEGEKLRKFQYSLKLENTGKVFLVFPITISHIIDHTSPLYDLSAKDLLEKKFEIILTITGSSRSTGQITQARTSYLPKEILWGHRFSNIISYDSEITSYVVDYEQFDKTQIISTPLCSANRLEQVINDLKNFGQQRDFFEESNSDEHLFQSTDILLNAENKENNENNHTIEVLINDTNTDKQESHTNSNLLNKNVNDDCGNVDGKNNTIL